MLFYTFAVCQSDLIRRLNERILGAREGMLPHPPKKCRLRPLSTFEKSSRVASVLRNQTQELDANLTVATDNLAAGFWTPKLIL